MEFLKKLDDGNDRIIGNSKNLLMFKLVLQKV